jgi:hypothetical protein
VCCSVQARMNETNWFSGDWPSLQSQGSPPHFQGTDRGPRPFSVPDALLREAFLPDTLQPRVVSCQFPGIIVRGLPPGGTLGPTTRSVFLDRSSLDSAPLPHTARI